MDKAFEQFRSKLSFSQQAEQKESVQVPVELLRRWIASGEDIQSRYAMILRYILAIEGESSIKTVQILEQCTRLLQLQSEIYTLNHPRTWKQRLSTFWKAVRP
jgi:hypothetical protein